MSTTVKVAFREGTKHVAAEVAIESDEMSAEEVLKQSRVLYEEASKYSFAKTIPKVK